jgi:outer membrane protein assembly factor BamB
MMPLLRHAVLLLFLLALPVGAQPPELAVDSASGRLLEAAAEYLQGQDWELAIPALQRLLDAGEDALVRRTAKGPGGRTITRLVSRRAEAEHLLSTLPSAGQDYYEKRYGPQAEQLLAEALKKGTEPALAEVLRRYAFTRAGIRALEVQAGKHAEAGQLELAALYYQRLLTRQEPKSWNPEAHYRAATAFERTGRKDLSARLLPLLLAEAGKPEGLTVAGKKLTAEQLKAELEKVGGQASSSWLMAGGNAARSLSLTGGAPFLQSRWRQDTARTKQALSWLTDADRLAQTLHQPILPASQPIAVTLHAEGKDVPLVVYRSQQGIEAVSRTTGKTDWESVSDRGLDRLQHNPRTLAATTAWVNLYLNQFRQPHLLVENSAVGTLSSDGRRVFAVDDYSVPPPSAQAIGVLPLQPDPELSYNRLECFDLLTGKLKWERSGADDPELKDALVLGAPLPVDGRLYGLVEKEQELLLVQLDPVTGKTVQKMPLAEAREKLVTSPSRRIQAVHLAVHQGVLVIPTNQGVVFGVDLLDHQLLWAHTYRDQAEPAPVRPIRPVFPMAVNPPVPLWHNTPPVLVDGKVVYTPPDGQSLLCLSVRDGSLLWKRPRGDNDLYLGGVVAGRALVVGSRNCQALDLATGQLAWTLATGMPSGFGAASNDLYYLPLRESAATKQPEVCVLDVKAGKIVAHARSPGQEVLGNLVFQDGDVISQTITGLAVYPQLSSRLKEIDETLKKNPNNPLGLHLRAEMLLAEGRLLQAVEDWRKALAGKLPTEVRGKIRDQLFEALSQALARDFNASEKYLPDLKELTTDQGKLEAEQRRRQVLYYRLLGLGRQAQGKPLEALKAYIELLKLPGAEDQMVPSIEEPGLHVAVPTWIRSRLRELLDRADAETRKQLEAELERRFKEIRSDKEPQALRGLSELLGQSRLGDRTRLALAEQLLKEEASAEVDQVLQGLRRSSDATMSARALELLVQNCLRQGLFADAVYYCRLLERDHAKTTVRPGKTGQDLFQELAQDRRVLPFLDPPACFPAGRIQVKEEKGTFPVPVSRYPLTHYGEPLPYFQHQRVLVRGDTNELQLEDARTQEVLWSLRLSQTAFLQAQLGFGLPTQGQRFPYQTVGHLAVVPMGHHLLAIDPVRKKVLWERNLARSASGVPEAALLHVQHVEERSDALVRIHYVDGWVQWAGMALPFRPGVVCVQARDALLALDPLTGRTLWSRGDVAANNHLFSDDSRLYVVEMNGLNVPVGVRAFRLADGASAPVTDFTTLYGKRLRRLGHHLLLADRDVTGKQTFRLYDVAKGEDVWKQTVSASAIVCETLRPELLAWVEPDGTIHVVDLDTRQELQS